MRGRIGWAVIVGVLALAACSNNTVTPTIPSGTTTTDTFTGTLNPAGGVTNTFTTLTSGTVTAALTTVGPDVTKPVGFAMGTFNTILNTCTIVLANDLALQGAILTAQASSPGSYCVRIYDTGSVPSDTGDTFTVTVIHP